MDFEEIAKAIWWSAHNGLYMSISGKQTEEQKAYFERVNNPEIGDWVFTQSKRHPYVEMIGKLEARPTKYTWEIRLLTGELLRWEEAQFRAIPLQSFRQY